MCKILFLIFFFFSAKILFSQNLIPNSGFENYTDELIRKHGLLTIYFNQNSWKSFGSIDLFSRVNETVPCNQFGKICPVSGKAYMGMNAVYPREIAQIPLKNTLEKDKTYCISFYVSTSNKTDTAVKLRVLFSDTLVVNFSGFVFYPKTILLSECETEMDSWKKVQAAYKARGSEKYFIIGNFDDELAPPKSKKHTWHSSYYFVDDVSVKEISDAVFCDCNVEITTQFFPLEETKCRCGLTAIANQQQKTSVLTLFFQTGEYTLDTLSLLKLDSITQLLINNANLRLSINGYADIAGKETDNSYLSFNRAKITADYLIRNNIEKTRLSYRGLGSIGTNENEAIKSLSRKVEIIIQ